MTSENPRRQAGGQTRVRRIDGQVRFDESESQGAPLGLRAHAFDANGQPLGSADVAADGRFELDLPAGEPLDVSVVISPDLEATAAREAQSYRQEFKAADWQREGQLNVLRRELLVPLPIWWSWRPIRVCITGHVRKVIAPLLPACRVPFVKVEVFDVDREACWWPYLVKWPERIIDPRHIRLPDLINPPFPPDPIGPIALATIGGRESVELNPQPEPPSYVAATAMEAPIDRVALNPQPLPPRANEVVGPGDPIPWSQAFAGPASPAVESANVATAAIAERISELTLSSIVAPWSILPHCFHSRKLVCTTYTDCNGSWECCFNWWPFHVRNGRFRYDPRPDVIIRVTQVINGVTTIIYMDPFSSTRWNVTGGHIDTYLDDPRVVCGPGCEQDPHLDHAQASLLQVGPDPTWHINQANGRYQLPPKTNGAFGGALYLRGDFSLDLKTAGTLYYRLQWKRQGDPDSAFQPIMTPLVALRALPFSAFSDHTLGPNTVAGVQGLYEVQDAFHWWLMPGVPGGPGTVIALWDTSFQPDEDTYVLRMDMFNAAGAALPAIGYPNHGGNGTGADPSPPPVSVGHLDTVVRVDNKPVLYSLGIPAANECGIILWSPTLPSTLAFQVHASQENGRVDSWTLDYTKGTTAVGGPLGSATYNAGTGLVNTPVSGTSMLLDPSTSGGYIEASCAFALWLRAWAHVRGNWGWIYYGEKLYAIAVERCP